MQEINRPPALQISQFRKNQSTTQYEQSASLTARRKRAKVEKVNVKSNEELIQQSHETLMNYIDNVDNQVKNLMENHEAQFLVAYRKHSSKVKQEMKQIKRKMLQNTQNQKVYIDRITYLQKQLILFREQMLKMSQKLIAKNDQIQILRIKMKELATENRVQKDSIIQLTKTNMSLSARLMKSNNIGLMTQPLELDNHIQKSYLSHLKQQKPQLRIRNGQRMSVSKVKVSTIDAQIAVASNSHNESIDDKMDSIKTDLPNNGKRSSSLRARIERSRMIQTQIQKFKSKSLAQRNEYQKIFVECVQQVRNSLMRKGFNESLNYFKQNGPKSLVQFRKLDYLTLMELFLRKDAISQKMYELIFEKQAL